MSVSLIWAFLCGVICLILVEVTIIYYLFFRSTNSYSNLSTTPSIDVSTFPQQLELLTEKLGENTTEGTALLNLLLQFWFRENRYDVYTLTAIANRINSELTELLINTSLGRIFRNLKIHDIELGSESPIINSVSLQKIDVNKELNTLNNFVFEFDIRYVGGFYMAIDARMRFNSKAAFVSVKVMKCVGRLRIEFTRLPYTYWCMSFISPPDLELVVESKLEGHSVPQLNRIIGIQLRRRINRKFVMPFYKIRSKPFLPTHNLINLKDDTKEVVPNGKLHITALTLSRIAKCEGTISCSLITDNNPWVKDVQTSSNHLYILQIFRRSNKDTISSENRKLSTGSLWHDRHQDGLRQRLKSMTGEENSYNIDELTRRKSFTESPRLFHKQSTDNVNQIENEETNIRQSKKVPYSELISLNEHFTFTIGSSARYLNILIWNHINDCASENLIGYISIPLINLIQSGIGHKRRIFYLSPPNQLKNETYSLLSTHPGFNSNLCYGDITLGVKFTSSDTLTPSLSSNENTPISLSPTKGKTPILFETTANLSDLDTELIASVHEFDKIIIDKQAKKCEFCQNKIWFKEATQCLKCGLICHKKCVSKCEKTECPATSSEYNIIDDNIEIATQAISINPEIITTAPDNNETSTFSKNKISEFLANVKGIRRSGSASSLAPPSNTDTPINPTHSLPQTPNHSPCPSRKSSVFSNDVTLFECTAVDNEVKLALENLMSMPQDERFLESVKISGKKLCVELPSEQREKRINEIISKIRVYIEEETTMYNNRLEETKNLSHRLEEIPKTEFSSYTSEERLQGLTNLMLHCCAGLQDSKFMKHNSQN
ncbi:hypothetical protein PGB90_002777 [Kerria lacca]